MLTRQHEVNKHSLRTATNRRNTDLVAIVRCPAQIDGNWIKSMRAFTVALVNRLRKGDRFAHGIVVASNKQEM